MNLPKWITDQDYAWEQMNNPDWNKLRKAITIAVEALETIKTWKNYHDDKSYSSRAEEALRCIEELGKL